MESGKGNYSKDANANGLSHQSVPESFGLVKPLRKQKEGKINKNGLENMPDFSSLWINFNLYLHYKGKVIKKENFLLSLTCRMTPFSRRLCFFAVITK